jgi:hypothetical protein
MLNFFSINSQMVNQIHEINSMKLNKLIDETRLEKGIKW